MRVLGKVGKYELHILIDTGSTHNFLNVSVAKYLGCIFKSTCPLQVTVAGGKTLISNTVCNFMWKLQDIKFNDQELRMGLAYKEKYVNLRGSIRPAVQWLRGKQLPKESPLEASNLDIQTPLKLLLEEFADVFAVPKGLPPNISHDHKIPLKEGTPPMNMRPYKHLPTQKDAIEVMVNELLETGVIDTVKVPFHHQWLWLRKKMVVGDCRLQEVKQAYTQR
ncbi:retrotransposable element Tf2 [Tanacetum coccineum]